MRVYLIGGPPRCGKTTLGKRLSRRLSIPWISADTLQSIAFSYIPKDELSSSFPHAYLPGSTNNETYGWHTVESIVDAYIRQAKTSYRAISMLAECTFVEKDDDVIVEGYQVTPEITDTICARFGADNVRSIFLIKRDERQFLHDIRKSSGKNDWILKEDNTQETLIRIAKMVSVFSDYFEAEARKYRFPLLNMDNGFEPKIEDAIESLVGNVTL